MSLRTLLGGLALAAAFGACPAAYAQSQFADPAPTIEKPRRIVLQLTSDDPKVMTSVLNNAMNIQKFYGQDRVEIAIVAFGPGMEALYKKGSPVSERVSSLLRYDITFVGCANTMESTHHTTEDLIEGVQVTPAGVAEIVERQLKGWIYVHP
jgi:uncharacterized protein